MQTRRYEFPPPNANPRDQGGPTVPTAEQQWSDFQKRVVNGQLTEAEKRLIRRSMEHSMETDRLESRMRTLESQLTKVGEQLADAAIRDGDLELEGKDEFLRRFEARVRDARGAAEPNGRQAAFADPTKDGRPVDVAKSRNVGDAVERLELSACCLIQAHHGECRR